MPKTPKADISKPPKKKRTTTARKTTAPGSKPRAAKPRGTGSRASKQSAPAPRRPVAGKSPVRKMKIAAPPPAPPVLATPAPPESLANALLAVEAAREKLARNMLLLDLRGMADFTDYFFICSGTNPRQVQAICDEIGIRMKQVGLRATHTEGYNHGEWVLLDYVDFVAHIFTEAAREYYDLERLWRTADRVKLGEDEAPPAPREQD